MQLIELISSNKRILVELTSVIFSASVCSAPVILSSDV